MTDQEWAALLDRALTPLTDEEYQECNRHRKLKTQWEYMYALSFELIDDVHEWIAYANGECERPAVMINEILRPGECTRNHMSLRVNHITTHYRDFEHGTVPKLPIAARTIINLATLINRVEKLHPSPEIADMRYHLREWSSLVLYRGAPLMDKKRFDGNLAKHSAGLLTAFHRKCTALFDLVLELTSTKRTKSIEAILSQEVVPALTGQRDVGLKSLAYATDTNETVRRIEERQKHGKGRRKFSLYVQMACYKIWIDANNDAELKASINRKLKYIDVYERFKSTISALGITNVNEFTAAINAYQQYLLRQKD